jgi:hypothetical protein
LPDGLFSNQKSKFGYILEALAMEDVGVFYGRLINFPGIWHILWWFGIFSPFWYILSVSECCTKKNLAALNTCYVCT